MCNDTINAILCAGQENLSVSSNTTSDTILDILMPGLNWYVFIILIVLLLVAILSLRLWRKVQRVATYRLLLWISAAVFAAGVAVYTVGALQGESMGFWDAVYTVPSAIISSLGMFVYQDDISELSDRAKLCSEFMASYSIVHLLAAIITSLIMLRWLGMLLFYWWRLRHFNKKSSELYIMWGINPASLSLAKSIRAARPKEEIVFINVPEEEEESGVNIHRLLDVIKLKDDVDSQIVDINATVTNCHTDVTDASRCQAKSIERFFLRNARLPLLSKIVKHAKQLHVFFLSTDETKNINATRNFASIAEAESVQEAEPGRKKSQRETHIYCHARNSALTQVFENWNIKNYRQRLRLHIIDSSKLSVQLLKKNVDDCPVSFVDIDTETATVCSAFRSMIIGFGETGEEVLKFLYEFGSFVNKEGQKTPFYCTVIDQKAAALGENFVSKNPCLKINEKDGNDRLDFVNVEMSGEGFWPRVQTEVEAGLSYLVIAINDDMASMNKAMEIAERAIRWRSVKGITKPLNIYVRCYDSINYAQMMSIAQDMEGNYENIKVKVFGGIEEIFNYKTIVDDTCLKEAKQYNWEYSGRKGSIEQCWIKGLNLEHTSEDLNNSDTENSNSKNSNIKDSQRRLEQNISNSLHKDTKLHLLEHSGYDCNYWSSRSLEREKNTTHYKHLNDKEKTVLLNIARLEHERWVASMKLQGWSPTPQSTDEKEIDQQLHNDMRPWDELRSEGPKREEVQGYDCDVVETSIRIALNKENVKYRL